MIDNKGQNFILLEGGKKSLRRKSDFFNKIILKGVLEAWRKLNQKL